MDLKKEIIGLLNEDFEFRIELKRLLDINELENRIDEI